MQLSVVLTVCNLSPVSLDALARFSGWTSSFHLSPVLWADVSAWHGSSSLDAWHGWTDSVVSLCLP